MVRKNAITTLVILTIAISAIISTSTSNVSAGQTPLVSIHPLMKRAGQTDIPLDQALVLEGGESTNPRDYDPATTYSAGDKRIFSGLVSFDPQLNLTADLADRWEISSDGTTYTFYLNEDAKFHNGRAVTAQDVIYS